MFFILKFDTHQSKRMRKLYKENEDLQPLFLQRSAEQKLKTLHTKLNGYMTPGAHDTMGYPLNGSNNRKQAVANQLNELIADYNNGEINIKNYNTRLNELISMVSEPKTAAHQKITNK